MTTLNELKELLSQIDATRIRDEKHKRQFEATENAKRKEEIEAQYREGYDTAQKQVSSLVRFLRFASHNCVHPSDDAPFNSAVEKLLVIVYEGTEKSEKAVADLNDSSTDVVPESEVSFQTISSRVDNFFAAPLPSEQAEELIEDDYAEQPEQAVGQPIEQQSISDDEARQTNRPLNRGIQFLNESEIEGQHVEEPALPSETSVPANSTLQVPTENVEVDVLGKDGTNIYPTQNQVVEQKQMQQKLDSMSPEWYQAADPSNGVVDGTPKLNSNTRGSSKRPSVNRSQGSGQRGRGGRGFYRGGRGRGGFFNRSKRGQYSNSNNSTSQPSPNAELSNFNPVA